MLEDVRGAEAERLGPSEEFDRLCVKSGGSLAGSRRITKIGGEAKAHSRFSSNLPSRGLDRIDGRVNQRTYILERLGHWRARWPIINRDAGTAMLPENSR